LEYFSLKSTGTARKLFPVQDIFLVDVFGLDPHSNFSPRGPPYENRLKIIVDTLLADFLYMYKNFASQGKIFSP
jgi:hypothetical protein